MLDSVLSSSLRDDLRRAGPRRVDLLPVALLFASLLVLRVQLAADMGLGPSGALGSGFLRGVYFDAVISTLAWGLAALVGAATATGPGIALSVLSLVIWLASLGNVLHYRFFSMGLDWWLVRLHWRDLFVIQGAAVQLAEALPFYASGVLLVAALVAAIARAPLARWLREAPADRRARRGRVAVGLMALALGAVGWIAPGWFGRVAPGVVLNDNVLHLWAKQVFGSRMVYGGAGTDWADSLDGGLDPEDLARPSRVLAAFRDLPTSSATSAPGSTAAASTIARRVTTGTPSPSTDVAAPEGAAGTPTLGVVAAGPASPRATAETASRGAGLAPAAPGALAPSDPEWPLVRRLEPDLERSRALRRSLGLPEEGPLNVIYLFGESMRAREFLHPELAHLVYPRTHAAIDGRSLTFRQTYASAFTAGQTVRGEFATQCSNLPNMLGAATYLAHTSVRVECITGLLRSHGYRTLWFNGFDSSFHGKRTFETLHGMESFYDRSYFESRGVTKKVGSWGIADREMLQESLRVMEELARDGRPFYANVLTIATHAPYHRVAEGPLPPELDRPDARPDYTGYLSQLVYTDTALADFFQAFFASSIADRTLVVLVGDHGVPPTPTEPLTHVQLTEMRFRVAMALVTKNMPRPGSIDRPIHQIDISPTVADILGVGGEVTWMGRDFLVGSGSPWMYTTGDVLDYRVGDRACYTELPGQPRRCYDLGGRDPLFDSPVRQVPEDPSLGTFFARVARANLRALALNLLAPPRIRLAAPGMPAAAATDASERR